MKKILLLALSLVITFLLNGQNPCQRATTALQCGQVISNCTNGTANNAMNGLTYWCLFDAYGSGSTGRDTVFRLQVDQTTTYRFILEMLNGKDMDIVIVKPTDFNNQCLFSNSCTQANGGFSYEYNHVYGIYREVLDIRLDPNPTPYLVFIDSKEPGQALFNLTVDCTCTGIEANNDLPTGDRIFCDDFENYVTDKVIEPQSTRWERPDTTLPDGQIVSAGFLGKGVRFQGSTGSEPEDHFLLRNRYSTTSTAGQSEGRYRISWKMRMEHGKKGYYAMEHLAPVNVPGGVFNDAYHVNFLENGTGELRLGSIANAPSATFPYPPGIWMNVVQIIDIDANVAELWINDNFVKSWTFSIGSAGNSFRLGSVKFKAGAGHDFKVDELCVWKGGTCTPTSGNNLFVENGAGYDSEQAARCHLYTSLEWGDNRSICDFGGTFIHRGDHYLGSIDNTDLAPNLLRNDPCVLAEYGGNLPDSLFADIYIFYKDDDQPVQVSVVEDDPNYDLKQFVFACNAPGAGGQCEIGPKCLTETSQGSGIFLTNTCDSFYYVVVTGGIKNQGYDLTIMPNGLCGTNYEDIIPNCGGSCSPIFFTGIFPNTSNFNAVGPGNAYESCYSGTRAYTGGEAVYRFFMPKPALLTLNLNANSPVGMALYSVICAKECIAFGESKGANNQATINMPVAEGVYYLVIDKSVDDNNTTYNLEFQCEQKSFFDLQSLLNSGGKPGKKQGEQPIANRVPVVCLGCDVPSFNYPYYHQVFINNQNVLSNDDEVHFLFREDSTNYLTGSPKLSQLWSTFSSSQKFSIPQDYKDSLTVPISPSLKCSYEPSDSFFIYLTQTGNGNHLFVELIPNYLPPGTGAATGTNTFQAGDTSIITSFTLGTPITWHVSTTRIEISPGGGLREFDFHTSIPWEARELDDAPWLDLSESSGTGGLTYKLRLNCQPNTSLLPRSTTLEFASTERPDIYRLYMQVVQLPSCTPPQITLEMFNSSLCDNDTVYLLANVGFDPVTGESLAPLYDFVWRNDDDEIVGPNPEVPAGQFAAILSTGTYRFQVEATAKYCDGNDTEDITFNITPPPPAPTPNSATQVNICTGDPFPTFSVVNPGPGISVQWYTTSTGGDPIATGLSYTPTNYATQSFYAATNYSNGDCSNASRASFSLTVNTPPTVSTAGKICTPDHQFYEFQVLSDATEVYVDNVLIPGNGGVFQVTQIPISNTVTVRILNQFCETTLMVAPPACICDVQAPTFIQHYSFCENAQPPAMSVGIQQPNTSVNWYSAAMNGTKLNATPTNSYTPQPPFLSAYFAEAVNLLNGCTSSVRVTVNLNILPLPTLQLTDTTCTAEEDFYSISLTTNGVNATANTGTKDFLNGIYTFSQIPITQSIVITVTGSNGCFQTTTVNPPNCPCLNLAAPMAGNDVTVCYDYPFTPLNVQVGNNQTANWYLNGSIVATGVTQYTPEQGGTYLIETYDPVSDCVSASKAAIVVTVLPEIVFSTSPPACAYDRLSYHFDISSGPNTAVSINGQVVSGAGGVFSSGDIPTGVNAELVITNLSTLCEISTTIVAPACPCVETIDAPFSPTSNQAAVCQGQPKSLMVMVGNNQTANWYNEQGILVQQNNTVFGPPTQTPGLQTYFAEAYNPITDCTGSTRTTVSFMVHPAPTVVASKACDNQTTYTVVATIANANTLTATSGVVTPGPNNTYTISGVNLGASVDLSVSNTQTGCVSVFTVTSPVNCDCSLLGDINPPTAGPIQKACTNQSNYPAVTASVSQPNVVIDWYEALGTLLVSGSPSYQPPSNLPAGVYTYFAEARNTLTQCISNTRTAVQLIVSDPPPLNLSTACEPSFLTYEVAGQTEPGLTVTTTAGAYVELAPGLFKITGITKGLAVTITVTNPATLCQISETVLLSTCPCPTVNKPISNGDQSMCQNDPLAPQLSVQLSNPNQETAFWYTTLTGGVPIGLPGVNFTPTPPPSGTTSYFVEARLQNGFCPSMSREEVVLEVKTRPTATAGLDQTACQGDTINLAGAITGAAGGFWSASGGQFIPDNGALTAQQFVAPFTQSAITLTLVTDDPSGPCPAVSSSMNLQLLQAPAITIDSVYCSPDLESYQVLFSANTTVLDVHPVQALSLGNQQYLASDIDLTQNLSIRAFNTGNSCDRTVEVVSPAPCNCPEVGAPVSQLGNVIERCASDGLPTIVVDVSPGMIVNWFVNETINIPFLANSIQFTPNFPGDFYVEAVDPANDCKSARIKITVILKSNPTVFAGPNATLCPGGSLTLSADAGSGYTYLWENGQTSQSITVTAAGTYRVEVELDGCFAVDSFVVDLHPALFSAISVVEPVHCFGFSNGVLSAAASGGTPPVGAYAWSNQSGSQVITGLNAGSYTVTITDQAGCTSTSAINLTQPAPLLVDNIGLQQPNQGQANGLINVIVIGGTQPYNYQWFLVDSLLAGQTQASIDSMAAGVYQVEITDAFGCATAAGPIQLGTVGTQDPNFTGEILVFPNPTSGQLSVKLALPEQAEVQMQVIDVLGRELLTTTKRTMKDGQQELNLSHFSDGLYWLRVNIGEWVVVKKIAKNH